jgi:hypothetical protein
MNSQTNKDFKVLKYTVRPKSQYSEFDLAQHSQHPKHPILAQQPNFFIILLSPSTLGCNIAQS